MLRRKSHEVDNSGLSSGTRLETGDRGGILISNDYGYKHLFPALSERFRDIEGGVGVFIGSGGMLSMLPDLNVDVVLTVDRDPNVLALNKLIADMVAISRSPDEVIRFLAGQADAPSHPVYTDLAQSSRPGDIRRIVGNLEGEAWGYGRQHWTNKSHFPRVKEALAARPQLWWQTDVSSPEMLPYLADLTQEVGSPIRFANFTNVHHWLDDVDGDMSFVSTWPIAQDPTLLYSKWRSGSDSTWPSLCLATSTDQLIAETNADMDYLITIR